MTAPRWIEVEHLHQPNGWISPGYLSIDEQGMITRVSGDRPEDWSSIEVERVDGYVVPGMPNLHSHAHQRGLAGRAEGGSGVTEAENFWSWRERMYAFLNLLDPGQFEAIAAQAYVEMLKAGFTVVGEFHYLHQDKNGRPYANPLEMSERVLAAASSTGIGLTLLPCLYTRGGVGRALAPEQRRFLLSGERFGQLVEALSGAVAGEPLARLGIAPHSLRAVDPEEFESVVAPLARAYPDAPIHIHVAEQTAEIEQCLQDLGMYPAAWLMDRLDVNHRWTFIHATHCGAAELAGMADRGLIVGLCPSTEANLGDGVFDLDTFYRAGGRFGIGTDSDTRHSVVEELRLVEYVQRLTRQRRSIFVSPGSALSERPGRLLFDTAVEAGARSIAQPVGRLLPGSRADLVVLEADAPALIGHGPDTILDAWVFAGGEREVRDVMVGGRWLVQGGRHIAEETVLERFRRVIEGLRDKV